MSTTEVIFLLFLSPLLLLSTFSPYYCFPFIHAPELTKRVQPLPDKSNPYLQGSLSVGIAKFPLREHSTNLPCRRKYYGLRTSTILYLLHLTLTTDHWLSMNVWCLKMPVCGSGVWLSNPCGLTSLFDLLGHSASDTSPQERMVSLVGCLNSEITRTTFSKLIFVYNFNVMCCMIW